MARRCFYCGVSLDDCSDVITSRGRSYCCRDCVARDSAEDAEMSKLCTRISAEIRHASRVADELQGAAAEGDRWE